MKLSEVMCILNGVAPVALSDEFCKNFGMYDNSGVIIDCGKEVRGALFSLDLSEAATDEAIGLGYNLIVTHHPAIYGGISRFDAVNDPQSRAIAKCLKNDISVISMHLNFDAAPRGIDYYLMRGLGGSRPLAVLVNLTGGGYGRTYEVEETVFADYVNRIKDVFSGRAIAYGGSDKKIKRVASFCGAGCDEKSLAFAVKHGADVFVSSDMKHHEIAALTARGVNVIILTHYASENYGFNKIYNDVKENFAIPTAYHTDDGLI